MYEFTIELAKVPIRIRCRYKANRAFFGDYLSEKEPGLEVEASEKDLQDMQMKFEKLAEKEGTQKLAYSDVFLENNALHELIAKGLIAHQVLLMHGSALCMDGQAYIFTASSGTGKSTHARLWREAFGDRVRLPEGRGAKPAFFIYIPYL